MNTRYQLILPIHIYKPTHISELCSNSIYLKQIFLKKLFINVFSMKLALNISYIFFMEDTAAYCKSTNFRELGHIIGNFYQYLFEILVHNLIGLELCINLLKHVMNQIYVKAYFLILSTLRQACGSESGRSGFGPSPKIR